MDIPSQSNYNYLYNIENYHLAPLSCQQIQAQSQKIASMGRGADYLFILRQKIQHWCIASQERIKNIRIKGGVQDCVACIKSYLLCIFSLHINREMVKNYMYYVWEPNLKAKYEMGTYKKYYYYEMGTYQNYSYIYCTPLARSSA